MSDQTASDTVHLSAGSGHGPGLSPAGQVKAESGPTRSNLAGPDGPQDVATTVGAKRSAFGQGGRALTVLTNHFEVEIPKQEIYHYNGTSHPVQFHLRTDTFNLYIMTITPSRCVFIFIMLLTSILSLTRAPSKSYLPQTSHFPRPSTWKS